MVRPRSEQQQRVLREMNSILYSPSADERAAMLALNNEFAVETSLLSAASMQELIASSFYVRVAGKTEAFCIALDQSAHYKNPNFDWFLQRYRRFVYIDRVVVATRARGQGIARKMYSDLTIAAKNADHTVLCCEVNVDPPNVASDRFHEAFGFEEVGQAFLAERAKTVRYLSLSI
jgi:predicted GNAT superfamily acetyltransferase